MFVDQQAACLVNNYCEQATNAKQAIVFSKGKCSNTYFPPNFCQTLCVKECWQRVFAIWGAANITIASGFVYVSV